MAQQYTAQKNENYFVINQEKKMYQDWFKEQFQNVQTITKKELKAQQKEMLLRIIQNELSEIQRTYFILYFYQNMRPIDIARQYGVSKSTVSRTLKRAAGTVRRFAKYLSPELYRIVEENPELKPVFRKKTEKRNNRTGRLG